MRRVQDWQGGWQPQLPLELAFLESIKPVVEDEPEPAPRPQTAPRTPSAPPPPAEQPRAAAAAPAAPGQVMRAADVKAKWGDIQKAAKRHHPSLPPLLEHVSVRDIKGDLLILGTSHVFQSKIEDKRPALEETLLDVLGVHLHVKVVIVSESTGRDQAVDELLAQDDVLAFGVDELGGEVTDFEE